MKRGELWTLRDDGYASKARPVVILQADELSFDSVVLCLLTSFELKEGNTRVDVQPSSLNNLHKQSFVMTEKIITVNKVLLGKRMGSLSCEDMNRIAKSIAKVLGITKEDLA